MINLLELRSEKGVSQRQIAKDMNVSQGTYNNWENGRTQPSIEQLIELASYFSVTIDYLVGRTKEYELVGETEYFSEDEKSLVRYFRSINDEAKKMLLNFLKNI